MKGKPNPNCPKCQGKGEHYIRLPDDVGSPCLMKCDCMKEKPAILTIQEAHSIIRKRLSDLDKKDPDFGWLSFDVDAVPTEWHRHTFLQGIITYFYYIKILLYNVSPPTNYQAFFRD